MKQKWTWISRTARVADRLGGGVLSWDQLPALLEQVDIVAAATSAPHAVLTRPLVERALAARGHPLVVLDIALPRDVESVQRLDDLIFDAGLWNGKNSGNHCAGSGADLSAVAMFDRPTMNAFTVYPDSRRAPEDSVGPYPGLYEIHQPDPDQAIYLHVISHYGLDPDLRNQGILIEPEPLDHGINILCSHGIFVGDERLYKAAERHGADRLVPTEWVLCDVRIDGIHDGFGHGSVYLWAQDGTLLATASQSAVLHKPRA